MESSSVKKVRRYEWKSLLELSDSPLSLKRAPSIPCINNVTCQHHNEETPCAYQKVTSRQVQRILFNDLFSKRIRAQLASTSIMERKKGFSQSRQKISSVSKKADRKKSSLHSPLTLLGNGDGNYKKYPSNRDDEYKLSWNSAQSIKDKKQTSTGEKIIHDHKVKNTHHSQSPQKSPSKPEVTLDDEEKSNKRDERCLPSIQESGCVDSSSPVKNEKPSMSEGKRIIYDREFLLDLYDSPHSQTRPNLPAIPGVTLEGGEKLNSDELYPTIEESEFNDPSSNMKDEKGKNSTDTKDSPHFQFRPSLSTILCMTLEGDGKLNEYDEKCPTIEDPKYIYSTNHLKDEKPKKLTDVKNSRQSQTPLYSSPIHVVDLEDEWRKLCEIDENNPTIWECMDAPQPVEDEMRAMPGVSEDDTELDESDEKCPIVNESEHISSPMDDKKLNKYTGKKVRFDPEIIVISIVKLEDDAKCESDCENDSTSIEVSEYLPSPTDDLKLGMSTGKKFRFGRDLLVNVDNTSLAETSPNLPVIPGMSFEGEANLHESNENCTSIEEYECLSKPMEDVKQKRSTGKRLIYDPGNEGKEVESDEKSPTGRECESICMTDEKPRTGKSLVYDSGNERKEVERDEKSPTVMECESIDLTMCMDDEKPGTYAGKGLIYDPGNEGKEAEIDEKSPTDGECESMCMNDEKPRTYTGKRITYDRKFLLEMRYSPWSQNSPNIPVVPGVTLDEEGNLSGVVEKWRVKADRSKNSTGKSRGKANECPAVSKRAAGSKSPGSKLTLAFQGSVSKESIKSKQPITSGQPIVLKPAATKRQSTSPRKSGRKTPIDYDTLLKWNLVVSPDDLSLELLAFKDQIIELLNSAKMSDDHVFELVNVFSKVVKCTRRHNMLSLLCILKDSFFILKHVPLQMLRLGEIMEEEKKVAFCEGIISIVAEYFTCFPGSFADMPLDALVTLVYRLPSDTPLGQKVDSLLQHREELVRTSLLRESELADRKETPPDNFRDIPTVPIAKDILDTRKPFLRPLRKIGCYNDDDHYLDAQYRLLREDMVSALREGVNEIVKKVSFPNRKHNLKVYNDVRILHSNCTNAGITHRIMFDSSHMDSESWKYSRRLIFGSLLCLSKDNFKTMIVATVTDRQVEDLREGVLDIRFCEREAAQKYCANDVAMVMVENPSYFEAYRHVLDGLKEMKDVPMSNYFVKCKTAVFSPKYIGHETDILYDLSGISKPDEDLICGRPLSDVAIMKKYKWPNVEQTVFNKSQLKAYMHALTEAFTLIQGPPGTGKTYVGLHVANALLQNKKHWDCEEQVPMLIVCYTNHALDQFLKGLVYFGHENLIRIGGRGCEDLKIFNLKNAIKDGRYSMYSERIRDAKYAAYQEKESIMEEMRPYVDGLKVLYDNQINGRFLSYDVLMNILPHNHEHHLSEWVWRLDELHIPVFDVFLGLCNVSPQQLMDVEAVRRKTDEDDVREKDGGTKGADETIEIEGEGDMLMERWAADVNRYKPCDFFRFQDNSEHLNHNIVIVDKYGDQILLPDDEERKRFVKEHLNVEEMSEEEALNVIDPWQLEYKQRWRLYKYWIKLFVSRCSDYIKEKMDAYEIACENLNEIYEQEEELVLRQADVIAMTTTCAAKYRNCLNSIKPKVVIIEEAAEVLEAHVITSLSDGLEHLVLVGDHKQLKPSPSVHELARKFSLEVSLFERMINNGMPFHLLDTQHRMRPGIARLLRHVYPQLNNHNSVLNYPNVLGVDSNLFFINHRQREQDVKHIKSKANHHEARFIKSFCLYLLQQGYRRSQITILTGYMGQLIALKNIMPRKQFEGVRVTAIDNYQGEENDIILLSLVRSNQDGRLGFMGVDNRIAVALSRAKMGLFVIGDFDMFEKGNPLWKKVLRDVRGMSALQNHLALRCQNHPDVIMEVANEVDFSRVPEGGCARPCEYRLSCGHVCQFSCHPLDKDHEKYVCRKRCNKPFSCGVGHKCLDTCHCGKDCEPCQVPVEKTLKCLHVQVMKCCEDPDTFVCQEKCSKVRNCGHACARACGEACESFLCRQLTRKKLNLCRHEVSLPCYMDTEEVVCTQECNKSLDCLHKCRGTCGQCKQGRLHQKCSFACRRLLICSHLCEEPCTSECPSCRRRCENRCSHSKCKKKCGEKCTPCIESCRWKCKHFRCSKQCWEMCDRPRCDEPCMNMLRCGHKCIGLCGELCPPFCRICQRDEVEEVFFGTESDPDARYIVLHDCKHMFEASALDRWMDIESQGQIKLKECPKCKTPIRRTLRYNNTIKRVLKDIEEVKEKMISSKENAKQMKSKGFDICREIFLSEMNLSERKKTPVAHDNGFPRKEELTKGTYIRTLLMSPVLSIRLSAILFSSHNLTDISRLVNQAIIWKGIWSLRKTYRKRMVAQVYTMLSDLECYLVQSLSRQQYGQALSEYHRLRSYLNSYQTIKDLSKLTKQSTSTSFLDNENLNRFIDLFDSGDVISDDELDQIDDKVEKIRKRWGLGTITQSEKLMIIKSIGLGKGHWFKCELGHIYTIGECGGAMEKASCPECGKEIGGTNHMLVAGNTHAHEFEDLEDADDGNVHPDAELESLR